MSLSTGADLHVAQLMPLPLTISCSSKSRLVLPFLFYLSGAGSPGQFRTKSKKAVKQLCECVTQVTKQVSKYEFLYITHFTII